MGPDGMGSFTPDGNGVMRAAEIRIKGTDMLEEQQEVQFRQSTKGLLRKQGGGCGMEGLVW